MSINMDCSIKIKSHIMKADYCPIQLPRSKVRTVLSTIMWESGWKTSVL